MSFVISYIKKSESYELSIQYTRREIPSPTEFFPEKKTLLMGEYFKTTAEAIVDSAWEDDPNVLNEFCSALVLIKFDESGCAIASDITGRELLYYYHDERRMIISDTFWGIVKIILPSRSDIDDEVVSEMISLGGGTPCDYKTPIRGLKWFPPNTIARFDVTSGSLQLMQYADVRRSGEVTSMDVAVESMDAAMTEMASLIAEKLPYKTFGLGLSGGLDSRVALHYFMKNGQSPICFNTCTKRPHKVLLANSVKKTRMLASAAGIECKEVEWKPCDFRGKANQMLRAQPLGTGGHYTNVYKYEPEGLPQFDVLLTAGQGIGPYLVGVSAADNSDSWDREDVLNYLLKLSHASAQPYSFTEHSIRKQLHKLGASFVDTEKGPRAKLWNEIVTEETMQRVEGKVAAFVDGRLSKGYRAADITLDFRTSTLGAIGRNGAYESSLGRFRNFTIYTPFLVKEGLRWDISLIEERKILKELILRKMPEFANVGEEEVGAVSKSRIPGSGTLNKIEFVLRGSGIMAEEWYKNDPVIRGAFFEDMTNDYEWFFDIIPAARDVDGIWNLSPARKNSVWEMKRLVDCIESGNYHNFE